MEGGELGMEGATREKQSSVAQRCRALLSTLLRGASGVALPCLRAGVLTAAALASVGGARRIIANEVVPSESLPTLPELALQVSAAADASLTAGSLWFEVFKALVFPLSTHAFDVSVLLYEAASPSVTRTLRDLRDAAIDAGPYRQACACLALIVGLALWAAQREIKRRRIVERITARWRAVSGRVARRYNAVVDSVRRRSRRAADALPHVVFWVGWGGLWYLAPELLLYAATRTIGSVLIFGWPAVAAARSVLSKPTLPPHLQPGGSTGFPGDDEAEVPVGEEGGRSQAGVLGGLVSTMRRRFVAPSATQTRASVAAARRRARDARVATKRWADEMAPSLRWLEYWAVVGMLWLAEELPLSGHVLEAMPWGTWPVLRLGLALWLQIPVTAGGRAGFAMLVSLLDRHIKSVPAPISSEQRSVVFNALVTIRVISPSTRDVLVEVINTGGTLLLLSSLFIVTPGFITAWGCALLGLGYPAYSTILCVRLLRELVRGAANSDGTSEDITSGGLRASALDCERWLKYWSLVPLLFPLHTWLSNGILGWLPLWTHLRLVGIVWLQLPYFRGANLLFDRISEGRLLPAKSKTSSLPHVEETESEGNLSSEEEQDDKEEEEEDEVADEPDDYEDNLESEAASDSLPSAAPSAGSGSESDSSYEKVGGASHAGGASEAATGLPGNDEVTASLKSSTPESISLLSGGA